MAMFVDHYLVLGLPTGEEGMRLTERDITKAFKAKALEVHPDKRPPDQAAAARSDFQNLTASYETLVDAKKRQEFNALLLAHLQSQQQQQQQQWRKIRIPKPPNTMPNYEEEERKKRQKVQDEEELKKIKEKISKFYAEMEKISEEHEEEEEEVAAESKSRNAATPNHQRPKRLGRRLKDFRNSLTRESARACVAHHLRNLNLLVRD